VFTTLQILTAAAAATFTGGTGAAATAIATGLLGNIADRLWSQSSQSVLDRLLKVPNHDIERAMRQGLQQALRQLIQSWQKVQSDQRLGNLLLEAVEELDNGPAALLPLPQEVVHPGVTLSQVIDAAHTQILAALQTALDHVQSRKNRHSVPVPPEVADLWRRDGFPALSAQFLEALANDEVAFRKFVLLTGAKSDAGIDELLRLARNQTPSHYHRLPIPVPHFTGRQDLRQTLAALLRQPGQAALVYGEPGSGKTSLLNQLAQDLAAHFHSVLFLECGDISPAAAGIRWRELLPDYNPQFDADTQLRQAREWAAGRRLLLVLDDVRSDALRPVFEGVHASLLISAHDGGRFQLQPAHAIVGFTPLERQEFFAKALGPLYPTLQTALDPLAVQYEEQPYALAVVAGLLQAPGLTGAPERLQKLTLATLHHGRLDVPQLWRVAVGAADPVAQRYLAAVATAQGPDVVSRFAAEVAEIVEPDEEPDEEPVVADLLRRGLLRLTPGQRDETRSRVALHSLLREWLRGQFPGQPAAPDIARQHAHAVRSRFAAWKASAGTRWRPCHEVKAEAEAALRWSEREEPSLDFQRFAYAVYDAASDTGLLDLALAAERLRETHCDARQDRANLQASLGNQALILHARGQLDEAMALHQQKEAICRDLGDRAGLSRTLGNQALILHQQGARDEGHRRMREAYQGFRDLGMPVERDHVAGWLRNLFADEV